MVNSSKNERRQSAALLSALCISLLGIAMVLGAGWKVAQAQDQSSIVITSTDVSQFPVVNLTLWAVDAEGRRLDTLPGLQLSEDGNPVTVDSLDRIPTGVEYIFIIDANEDFLTTDVPNGLTRREQVRDSLLNFANSYMDQSQLDRVSVIVPGLEEGEFLIERTEFHTALINEINFYEPEELGVTPLNEMMNKALLLAEETNGEGRPQVAVLFTDAGQISEQLDFDAITARAQEANTPIYSIILGARADEDEVESVSLLADPTGGSYVHLEEVASADPLYAMLADYGVQQEIAYRSRAGAPGEHIIVVDVAGVQDTTAVTLDIAPPGVEMAIDNSSPIRRVLSEADAPLASAEPTHQPIVAHITWPDGHPRTIDQATLLVDGREQDAVAGPEITAENLLTLDWDIADLDEGEYELVVQVTDELGFQGESDALPMNLEVARPAPPVPTAAEPQPTPVPAESGGEDGEGFFESLGPAAIIVAAVVFVAALAMVIAAVVLIRQRRPQPAMQPAAAGSYDSAEATQVMMPAFAAKRAATAYLEPLENATEHSSMISLTSDNVAVGRDPNLAQIVFANKSVSRLHARIMKRGGVYQLYDEGSASGTYINYEQVSLTPQNIRDKDDIHFGQVHVRFHLSGPAQDDDATQIMQAPARPGAEPAEVDDDMSTQPYMPNRPASPDQPQPPAESGDDEDDISTQPYIPHSPKR